MSKGYHNLVFQMQEQAGIRLIMFQNSIFLPVVANGFLLPFPNIKWNFRKRKSCQKKKNLWILVLLATMSCEGSQGLLGSFLPSACRYSKRPVCCAWLNDQQGYSCLPVNTGSSDCNLAQEFLSQKSVTRTGFTLDCFCTINTEIA